MKISIAVFMGLIASVAPPVFGKDLPFALSRVEGTVSFEGHLTTEAVQQMKGLLAEGDTLVVKSGGGKDAAALDLADAIVEKHIALKINGYCLSACANVLVVAANGNVDLSDSAIGYHWSGWAMYGDMLKHGYAPSAELKLIHDRYAELYARQNVNIELLNAAMGKVDFRGEYRQGDSRARVYTRYVAWIPTDKTLSSYGLVFSSSKERGNSFSFKKNMTRQLTGINPKEIVF